MVEFGKSNPKLKINLICRGNDHFLKPLREHWEKDRGWEIVDINYPNPDVTWVEWANEQSVLALARAKRRNVIVRMLGSEYWQNFWKQWKTENLFCVVQSSGVTMTGDTYHVIPPAIDTDFWLPSDQKRNKRLLVVGNFIYLKNHIGLLRTLSERPAYYEEVCFIGPIPSEPGKNKTAYIETNKIIDLCNRYATRYDINLSIEPKMSSRELRQMYHESEVLVCPAVNSFSAVVGEALSCGTKAIIADWPGAWHHWPQEVIYTTGNDFWNIVDNYDGFLPFDRRRKWVEDHLSPEVIYKKVDALIERAAHV